jgi:hypothetical protein
LGTQRRLSSCRTFLPAVIETTIGVSFKAARESTTLAIETLRTIASDTEAPHAARVSAATALLDRAWGKPAQQLSADINAAQTVTINLGWLKGRTVGGFIEHDEDSQARGD